MENKTLVSIIMPAYNVAPYIEASVQSVIDQTYPNCLHLLPSSALHPQSIPSPSTFGEGARFEVCSPLTWGPPE